MVKRVLSDLLIRAGYHFETTPEATVVDVTEDSREVEPGWLFVAIKGTHLDGGTYVADATRRGASAIVAEVRLSTTVPCVVVPDARAALADIAAEFHGHPSRKMQCFGVSGTDGKTTTCYFLKSILETSGYQPGLMSTVQTVIGRSTVPSADRLTTQSASHVQRILAKMAASGDDAAVIEASSHALAQDRLRQVSLAAAAITNIGEDHIEFHTSREQYARAKWGLFDLVEHSESPRVSLNADDEWSMRLVPELEGPFRSFSMDLPSDLIARQCNGFECELVTGSQTIRCILPRGGRHNVYNALAAASLALSTGIDLPTIARGLTEAEMPAGRLEPITAGQVFDVYVDYAHTVQAFGATLSHLQAVAEERGASLIAVFGAAGNRDRAKRPRLAEMAAAYCRVFVITNEDPFEEDAETIIDEICKGAPKTSRGSQWFIEPDRREAMEIAFASAEPGDIVVITGKGHESSIAVGNTPVPWNDSQVAREILSREARTSVVPS